MNAFPLLRSKESSYNPVASPPQPVLMHLQTSTAGASWQLHPPPLSLQCLLLGTKAAQRHTSHCAHMTQNSTDRTQTHNTLRPVTHMQVASLKPPCHCHCCSLQVAQQLHLEAWRILGEILRLTPPPPPPGTPHTSTASVSMNKVKKRTNKQTNKQINKGINK